MLNFWVASVRRYLVFARSNYGYAWRIKRLHATVPGRPISSVLRSSTAYLKRLELETRLFFDVPTSPYQTACGWLVDCGMRANREN
jgi:hypothetical protein